MTPLERCKVCKRIRDPRMMGEDTISGFICWLCVRWLNGEFALINRVGSHTFRRYM